MKFILQILKELSYLPAIAAALIAFAIVEMLPRRATPKKGTNEKL